MAPQTRDPLADLELHRQRLQDTLEKLRESLRHWQIWEAEYDGLKEEIQALPPNASFHDLARVSAAFGGDLVDEKETRDLLGLQKGVERTPDQVIDLLSKRVEYVQRNVDAIKGQIQSAEHKLGAVSIVAHPDSRNEQGLPITDIYEELDDDGHVVSSSISHPDKAQPQIIDALQKAGLKSGDLSAPDMSSRNALSMPNVSKNSSKLPSSIPPNQMKSKLPQPEAANSSLPQGATSNLPAKNSASDLARGSFPAGDRVVQLDESDNIVSSFANPAVEDSPEEAALRRQMQAYSMEEVGNIVAQLDIDDEKSQGSSMDEDDDFDMIDADMLQDVSGLDEDYEISDDENDYGIDANGRLTDAYIQQMLDLEQKLNARAMQNIGPGAVSEDELQVASGARRLVVESDSPEEDSSQHPAANKAGSKDKSIRFAETLDVAPTPRVARKPTESLAEKQQQPIPVATSIVERAAPSQPSNVSQPRKVSRFKQSRRQDEANFGSAAKEPIPPTLPNPSSNTPVAKTVLERTPQTAHELGGFKRPDVTDDYEPDVNANDDEQPGRKKKQSLFKAARAQAGGL